MSRPKTGNITEAFFAACPDAQKGNAEYVSLYRETPYYGGPEEGGWWGSDNELVAYHRVATEDEATALKASIEQLASKLNAEAKDDWGRACLRECEWLDARGLDHDFLRETDGETSYWVATEQTPGSFNSTGCRHYE